MITNKKLECFVETAVELVDIDGEVHQGWFIKAENKYKLYPFDRIGGYSRQGIYVFKVSHIKSIKHLTNGYEIRR